MLRVFLSQEGVLVKLYEIKRQNGQILVWPDGQKNLLPFFLKLPPGATYDYHINYPPDGNLHVTVNVGVKKKIKYEIRVFRLEKMRYKIIEFDADGKEQDRYFSKDPTLKAFFQSFLIKSPEPPPLCEFEEKWPHNFFDFATSGIPINDGKIAMSKKVGKYTSDDLTPRDIVIDPEVIKNGTLNISGGLIKKEDLAESSKHFKRIYDSSSSPRLFLRATICENPQKASS